MKSYSEGSSTNRHVTKMRWAAKSADLAIKTCEVESSKHARAAVDGFIASAQMRANAERLAGNAARTAQLEAYATAERAAASLDEAQRHSSKAREQKILAAHLRFIVGVEELDEYGGASVSTDASPTFSMFQSAGNRHDPHTALSYGDAS